MRRLIAGARVVDPQVQVDHVCDLLLENGRIAGFSGGRADEVVDGRGCWVLPGLCDMHVHLREPGQTHKEDLASGLQAALFGGVTAVGAMANTDPVVDDPDLAEALMAKAERLGLAGLHQYGALTRGAKGALLTDFRSLKKVGVRAVSDDGWPVKSSRVMANALREASAAGLLVIVHEEDPELSLGAPVNRGCLAYRWGLPGQPWTAEATMVARDVLIAKDIGARLHVAHVSTKETVAVLRWAKSQGIAVSAEVTPHHLLQTEGEVASRGSLAKMNPPLRTDSDRWALLEGLVDGTVDVIATDHAPHDAASKALGVEAAPFGVIGLETALPLIITCLITPGLLSLGRFIEAMSHAPRRLLGLEPHRIELGSCPDLVLVDPGCAFEVSPGSVHSKSQNSSFLGRQVYGKVRGVQIRGNWIDGC